MDAIYISRAGYKKLYEQYLQIDAKIAEVYQKMGESAQEDQDLMDNSEFQNLRVEAMYNLPRKKSAIYQKYKKAIIIEDTDEYKNFDGQTVILGTEVKLLYGGSEEVFKILGHDEGDYRFNILSCDAPLAERILKKKVGCRTDFNGIEICILSVNKIE